MTSLLRGALGVLLGLGGAASVATSASAAPLNGGVSEGGTTMVVVPMGHLHDPLNTFFQTFTLASGAWRLTTPSAVGSNGGVVLASPSHGFAAVLPFDQLKLTGLSQLVQGRETGQFETVPAVVTGPSALSVNPTTGFGAAVTRSGAVITFQGLSSTPTRLTSFRALRGSAAGRRCGLSSLTGVAVTSADRVVVAGTCRNPGVLGVFTEAANGSWSVTTNEAIRASTVVRIDAVASGVVALTASTSGPRSLRAVSVDESDVEIGAPLMLHAWSLRSTAFAAPISPASFGAGGTDIVAVAGRTSVRAFALTAPGNVVPLGSTLPATTQAVVELPASAPALHVPDAVAFSVVDGRASVRSLTSAGMWTRTAVIHVVIPYGSAS